MTCLHLLSSPLLSLLRRAPCISTRGSHTTSCQLELSSGSPGTRGTWMCLFPQLLFPASRNLQVGNLQRQRWCLCSRAPTTSSDCFVWKLLACPKFCACERYPQSRQNITAVAHKTPTWSAPPCHHLCAWLGHILKSISQVSPRNQCNSLRVSDWHKITRTAGKTMSRILSSWPSASGVCMWSLTSVGYHTGLDKIKWTS